MNGPTALASTPRIGLIHGTDLGAAGRFPAVTLAIGGAWATLVVAQLSGEAAALHHHALIEGGVPPALAILSFTVAWQVMVVAMMWPASLHAVAAVGLASPATRRAAAGHRRPFSERSRSSGQASDSRRSSATWCSTASSMPRHGSPPGHG